MLKPPVAHIPRDAYIRVKMVKTVVSFPFSSPPHYLICLIRVFLRRRPYNSLGREFLDSTTAPYGTTIPIRLACGVNTLSHP